MSSPAQTRHSATVAWRFGRRKFALTPLESARDSGTDSALYAGMEGSAMTEVANHQIVIMRETVHRVMECSWRELQDLPIADLRDLARQCEDIEDEDLA
jgi:hypothetical protein